MFAENMVNAKTNLQGRILKSFSVIMFSFVSFIFFISSSFCCIYLLIIDTTFLGNLGIFENQYVHAAVCAFAVIENMILFMLHIYTKIRKDCYFYFIDENFKISINTVYKAIVVYSLKAAKKIISFILFNFPFTAVFVLIINLLQQGISYFSLITFSVCDIVLLIAGLYSYSVYIQKYQLLPFVLIQNQDESIRNIFSLSAKLMNGKCKILLKLKISNLPKKLLCLFVIPLFYYLPYCKAVEADFVLQKEKPHMRRKAYTEKPIVFYFKPVKEN